MEEANKIQAEKKAKLEKDHEGILNEKKQDQTFQKRLWNYNEPKVNALLAIVFQAFNGISGPLTGWFIVKCLFTMIKYHPDADEYNAAMEVMNMDPFYYNTEKMKEQMQFWLLAMVFMAFGTCILNFCSKLAWGVVGENITLNIRD